MGMVKGLIKGAIIMKVFDIVQREARKPENQRKARELFAKVSDRASRSHR